MANIDRKYTEMLYVKRLGQSIGYGNLMSWASALWRQDLKKDGLPECGAFVPTIGELGNSEIIYDEYLSTMEDSVSMLCMIPDMKVKVEGYLVELEKEIQNKRTWIQEHNNMDEITEKLKSALCQEYGAMLALEKVRRDLQSSLEEVV